MGGWEEVPVGDDLGGVLEQPADKAVEPDVDGQHVGGKAGEPFRGDSVGFGLGPDVGHLFWVGRWVGGWVDRGRAGLSNEVLDAIGGWIGGKAGELLRGDPVGFGLGPDVGHLSEWVDGWVVGLGKKWGGGG